MHILKDILLEDRKIQAFLSQKIKVSANKTLSREMIEAAIKSHFPDWEIDPSVLLAPMSAWFQAKGQDTDHGPTGSEQDSLGESDYRWEEYRVFCRDVQDGYPKTNLLIRSSPIDLYGDVVRDSFERVSQLHKLRETRAFVGFSRIYPGDDLTQEERWRLLALKKKRWLPAVIVRGEGIFLKFREDRLLEWLARHGAVHTGRLQPINQHMTDLRARRHQMPQTISPKHVPDPHIRAPADQPAGIRLRLWIGVTAGADLFNR
jgi:hypothetical protein